MVGIKAVTITITIMAMAMTYVKRKVEASFKRVINIDMM